MACRISYLNSVAGLYMETWCGLDKVGGKPSLVCTVDDQTDAKHFVEVQNLKTYSRKINVKGIITSVHNKAKFVSVSPCQDREWEASQMIYTKRRTDTLSLGIVQIVKVSKGQETIQVEVQYEDPWNPGRIKRADVPSHELVFSIDLA